MSITSRKHKKNLTIIILLFSVYRLFARTISYMTCALGRRKRSVDDTSYTANNEHQILQQHSLFNLLST